MRGRPGVLRSAILHVASAFHRRVVVVVQLDYVQLQLYVRCLASGRVNHRWAAGA